MFVPFAHDRVQAGYHTHYKGGLYYVQGISKHTETGEELVNYVHIFPFEASTWSRPLADFVKPGRFVPMTPVDAYEFQKQDRDALKEKIEANKDQKL